MSRLQRSTLSEVGDRELMLVVADLEDGDGLVDTRAVSDMLNIDHPNPTRCVSSRLNWMRRWGFVRKGKAANTWRITAKGRQLVQIQHLEAEARVRAMTEPEYCATIAAAGRRARLSAEARKLADREWRHYRAQTA
jgi:hypothetical protein